MAESMQGLKRSHRCAELNSSMNLVITMQEMAVRLKLVLTIPI